MKPRAIRHRIGNFVRALLRVAPPLALGGVAVGCSLFGVRSGYETPEYTVLEERAGGVEIRRYGARLAAETVVAGARDEAMDEAFRILAAYIFAREREGEKVAMTAPVEVEPARPIGMTTPVATRDGEDGVTMRFFMPNRYTRASLPDPEDPRVRIVSVPGETVAALRFSGSGGSDVVEERKVALRAGLVDSGWRIAGEPAVLYYDPPWTLPFLRRNEVVVPVEEEVGPG